MKYVSPEYQQKLDDLAETLCTRERFAKDIGQLVLFESEMGNTTTTLPIPENILVGEE